MKLAKKELSDIHRDWIEELDKFRKKEVVYLKDVEESEEILEYVKLARAGTGKGVVSFRILSDLIEKRFGHRFTKSAIMDWLK